MKRILKILVLAGCFFEPSLILGGQNEAQIKNEQTDSKYFEMSLIELSKIKVVSSSRSKESLSDSPATMIVITQEQIKQRGYQDLIDLLGDLPGFDSPDTYMPIMRWYVRGFRKGTTIPFLFMIDGIIMNSLWFNWTNAIVSVPLSNIRQVEIVYGPASSLYGPNAMAGVVNVITNKDRDKNGTHVNTRLSAGKFDGTTDGRRIGDIHVLYKKEDFRIALTAFYADTHYDPAAMERFEYTSTKHANEEQFWGPFANISAFNRKEFTPNRMRGASLITYYDDLELGLHYYRIGETQGFIWATDSVHPLNTIAEEEKSLHLRHRYQLGSKVTASSLIRYRTSNIVDCTVLVGSNTEDGKPLIAGAGQTEDYEGRHVSAKRLQEFNNSWSIEQLFQIDPFDVIRIQTGLKFENKDLQKEYDSNNPEVIATDNTWYPNDSYPTIDHHYGRPYPEDTPQHINRVRRIDMGVFGEVKWQFSDMLGIDDNQFLVLGGRVDDSSTYGTEPTLRGGYVGGFEIGDSYLGAKLMYGEAIQEPTAKELYGSWAGAMNNPGLLPERTRTFDAHLSYTASNYGIVFNPYMNLVKNVIIEAPHLVNLGEQTMLGFDVHLSGSLKFTSFASIRLWAYYSYLMTKEQKFNVDEEGNLTNEPLRENRTQTWSRADAPDKMLYRRKIKVDGPVGDMPAHKVHVGVTGILFDDLTITLRGRYIGKRRTVDTNPIAKIESSFVLDLALRYQLPWIPGLTLAFNAENLLDAHYYFPGLRAANSGDTPGQWVGNKWYGNLGMANSKIPQPGRYLAVTLAIEI